MAQGQVGTPPVVGNCRMVHNCDVITFCIHYLVLVDRQPFRLSAVPSLLGRNLVSGKAKKGIFPQNSTRCGLITYRLIRSNVGGKAQLTFFGC